MSEWMPSSGGNVCPLDHAQVTGVCHCNSGQTHFKVNVRNIISFLPLVASIDVINLLCKKEHSVRFASQMLYHWAHNCPVAFNTWVWLYGCNKWTISVEENRLCSCITSVLLCVLYGADVSVPLGEESMGFHHINCRIPNNQ